MITSKKYKTEYPLKNGKKTTLIVKFDQEKMKKLMATGLVVANILLPLTGCISDKNINQSIGYSSMDFEQDIEYINRFLKNNPNLLRKYNYAIHTMEAGDTISGLAAESGSTIKEICELNNIKDPNRVQYGAQIKYKNYEKISELDKEIIMYEKYLNDYFPNSDFVKKFYQMDYHKDAEYSLKAFISDLDTGIMSKVSSAGFRFYGENSFDLSTKSEEEKSAYLDELINISEEVDAFNKVNSDKAFIPYEIYRVYLLNGHTLSTEIEEKFINIYN